MASFLKRFWKIDPNCNILVLLDSGNFLSSAFVTSRELLNSPRQGSFFTRNSSRAIQPPPTRTITVLRKIRTRRSCWESPNCGGEGKENKEGMCENTDLCMSTVLLQATHCATLETRLFWRFIPINSFIYLFCGIRQSKYSMQKFNNQQRCFVSTSGLISFPCCTDSH